MTQEHHFDQINAFPPSVLEYCISIKTSTHSIGVDLLMSCLNRSRLMRCLVCVFRVPNSNNNNIIFTYHVNLFLLERLERDLTLELEISYSYMIKCQVKRLVI